MYRILAILVLVGSAHAQANANDIDREEINSIFKIPNQAPTTTKKPTITVSAPSAIVPTVNTNGNRGRYDDPDDMNSVFKIPTQAPETVNPVTIPTTTKKPTTIDSAPSAIVPTVNTNDTPCITKTGQEGVCVKDYFCNNNEMTNTDDTDNVDISGPNGGCSSFLDICCPVSDQRPPTDPITLKPEPEKPMRVGCGWANPEGVGIKTTVEKDGETKFGEFPWMVAILKMDPVINGDTKIEIYVSGGSLIHPSAVLSAAHYVAKVPKLRVRAGEWDTQSTKESYPYQDREVESVAIHKDFDSVTMFYDISILFLKSPMEMTPNVGVVCLPLKDEPAMPGTRCIAMGWGKDKYGKEGRHQTILKKVEVPVVNRNTCMNKLQTTILGSLFYLHESFMCAGGEPGKDTCKGDGGSPLVCPIEYEDNRYVQNGIVTWGMGCGETGIPGVYVDISKMRDWIGIEITKKQYEPNVFTPYFQNAQN